MREESIHDDPSFDAEISMIRTALVSRYQTMLAGVQCGSTDYSYFQIGLVTGRACAIVCADINVSMNRSKSSHPLSW